MPAYVVKAGIVAVPRNGSRAIARKSNGELWCCYTQTDGVRDQIYCSYSIDLGINWIEEQVSQAVGANDQASPSIAIDSADNVHVVWHGLGWGANPGLNNIQYRSRIAAVWQPREAITDLAFIQTDPAIAVDSIDNIHVVWTSNGGIAANNWDNIIYRERTAAWQPVEMVTNNNSSNRVPSIAICSSNNIHVVWQTGAFGGMNIIYRERTTFWQPGELVVNTGQAVLAPCIAIDSEDNIHVVWYYYNGVATYDIHYRNRTTAWQPEETVYTVPGENSRSPTIAINLDDSIHVAWQRAPDILHAQRAVPWPAPDNVVPGIEPNLIWATHPTVLGEKTNIPVTGYAFLFDGINANYWTSVDLAWSVPIPTVISLPAVQTLAATGVT